MNTKRLLFATEAGFGGICFLANEFNCYTLLRTSIRKYYDDFIDNKIYFQQNESLAIQCINDADHIIFFGIRGIDDAWPLLIKSKKKRLEDFKRVTIIITDSYFFRKGKYWDKFLKLKNVDVLIMPDLVKYLSPGISYRPFYQYIPISHDYKIVKNNNITISHSPGFKLKTDQKGTKAICRILKGYNLDIISGVTWQECVNRKSKSHIFIDQIPHENNFNYNGALAKSGLEAMLVNCLTIASGQMAPTEPFFESPPVILADENNLKSIIDYYISSPEQIVSMANKQLLWARKNLSKDFVKRNILNEI